MAKEVGKSQEIVLRAIKDLYEHSQYAYRKRLQTLTSLSLNQVDEAIKTLHEKQLIHSPTPGYYEPVDQSIDRVISATALPMGRTRLDVGDDVIDLTPREAFALAKLLAGVLFAFAKP